MEKLQRFGWFVTEVLRECKVRNQENHKFWRQGTPIYRLWGPYSNIRFLYSVPHLHIRILACIYEYYSNMDMHIWILFEYDKAYSNIIRIWQFIFKYLLIFVPLLTFLFTTNPSFIFFVNCNQILLSSNPLL